MLRTQRQRLIARKALTTMSAVLFMSFLTLWLFSIFHSDTLGWAGWKDKPAGLWCGRGMVLERGTLEVYLFSATVQIDDPHHTNLEPNDAKMQPHFFHRVGAARVSLRQFRWKNSEYRWVGGHFNGGFIQLPLWLLAVIFGAMPSWYAFAILRKRLAAIPGHCLVCSYDLTGNISGVCPECGTAAAANKQTRTETPPVPAAT